MPLALEDKTDLAPSGYKEAVEEYNETWDERACLRDSIDYDSSYYPGGQSKEDAVQRLQETSCALREARKEWRTKGMDISMDATKAWRSKQDHREARVELPRNAVVSGGTRNTAYGLVHLLERETRAGRTWTVHARYLSFPPALITLCRGMTGRDAKALICGKHGVSTDSQRLSVNGRHLADTDPLDWIQEDATILVECPLLGGAMVLRAPVGAKRSAEDLPPKIATAPARSPWFNMFKKRGKLEESLDDPGPSPLRHLPQMEMRNGVYHDIGLDEGQVIYYCKEHGAVFDEGSICTCIDPRMIGQQKHEEIVLDLQEEQEKRLATELSLLGTRFSLGSVQSLGVAGREMAPQGDSPSVKAHEIHVQSPEVSMMVSLQPEAPVMALKEEIARRTAIPCEAQRLVYQGRTLLDCDLCRKVSTGGRLELALRALGGAGSPRLTSQTVARPDLAAPPPEPLRIVADFLLDPWKKSAEKLSKQNAERARQERRDKRNEFSMSTPKDKTPRG